MKSNALFYRHSCQAYQQAFLDKFREETSVDLWNPVHCVVSLYQSTDRISWYDRLWQYRSERMRAVWWYSHISTEKPWTWDWSSCIQQTTDACSLVWLLGNDSAEIRIQYLQRRIVLPSRNNTISYQECVSNSSNQHLPFFVKVCSIVQWKHPIQVHV